MSSLPKQPSSITDSPLGRESEYVTTYTPSLLHSIPRTEARSTLNNGDIDLDAELPFFGAPVRPSCEFRFPAAPGRWSKVNR